MERNVRQDKGHMVLTLMGSHEDVISPLGFSGVLYSCFEMNCCAVARGFWVSASFRNPKLSDCCPTPHSYHSKTDIES